MAIVYYALLSWLSCCIATVQSLTLPKIIAVGTGNENEQFAAIQLQTQLAKSNITCTVVTPESAQGKAHIAVGYQAGLKLCIPEH